MALRWTTAVWLWASRFRGLRSSRTSPEIRGFLFGIPWRKLEEITAGALERVGWPEVTLTPASGDKGRELIATKPGIGSIKIIGQVRAYAAGHRVDVEAVKAGLGNARTRPRLEGDGDDD